MRNMHRKLRLDFFSGHLFIEFCFRDEKQTLKLNLCSNYDPNESKILNINAYLLV